MSLVLCLSYLCLLMVTGCSSETRDRWWQTLDPAGYKHHHSEVFNPRKYRSEDAPAPKPDARELELYQP